MNKIRIIDRIKHRFGIHKYYYVQRLSQNCHQFECCICKKLFGVNTSCHVLIEWDLELEDFHKSMGHIKEILKELPESKIEVVPDDPKDQEVANQMTQLIKYASMDVKFNHEM